MEPNRLTIPPGYEIIGFPVSRRVSFRGPGSIRIVAVSHDGTDPATMADRCREDYQHQRDRASMLGSEACE